MKEKESHKKKQKADPKENYLMRCPLHREDIRWETDEKEMVTLLIENTGVFNHIAQILFKKPKISYIHLDEIGSFVWPRMVEGRTIMMLGEDVKERFGEKAEPLYERLAKYFQILDSYGFIVWEQKQ